MAGLGGGLGEGLQTFMYQMAQYLPGRVAPRQVEKTTSDEGWPVKAHTQVGVWDPGVMPVTVIRLTWSVHAALGDRCVQGVHQ